MLGGRAGLLSEVSRRPAIRAVICCGAEFHSGRQLQFFFRLNVAYHVGIIVKIRRSCLVNYFIKIKTIIQTYSLNFIYSGLK